MLSITCQIKLHVPPQQKLKLLELQTTPTYHSRDEWLNLLAAMQHHLQHVLLVSLRPSADGQLRDLDAGVAKTSHSTVHVVLGGLCMVDTTSEVLVARHLCRKGRGRGGEGKKK